MCRASIRLLFALALTLPSAAMVKGAQIRNVFSGFVGGDDRTAADRLAQCGVGRRRLARGPMQRVDQAAGRDVQAEALAEPRPDLAKGRPSCAWSTAARVTACGLSCAAAAPRRPTSATDAGPNDGDIFQGSESMTTISRTRRRARLMTALCRCNFSRARDRRHTASWKW